MILKRLVLSNYKQHSAIDQAFTGNVIGIIGKNGSGKSNLLGALHFAFAGEQPGFKRTDLLKWGTASGSVDLYFSHNGVDGHIFRSLNTSEARFTYGKDKYNGIAKVAEAVQEHLGMDKDLLKQTIFVRQSEIDDILFTDPRIRELAFQRLCGIGEAAKINKQLGEILGALATPPNYDEQIVEGTARRAQIASKVDELKTARTQMDGIRSKLPSAKDLQAQVTILERAKSACTRLTQLMADVDKYVKSQTAAETELTTLPTDVLDLTQVDTEIETVRNTIVQANNYAKALLEWETVGKQLVALGDEPQGPVHPYAQEQIDYLTKTVNELSAVFNDAQGNLKLYTGVLAACRGVLATNASCPLCGNTITDSGYLATKVKLLEDKVNVTNPAKYQTDLNSALNANRTGDTLFQTEIARYRATYESLTRQFKACETRLDSAKEGAAVKDQVTQLTAKLHTLQQQRQSFIASSTRRTTLVAQITSTKGYLSDLAKTIGDERLAIANYNVNTVQDIQASSAVIAQQLQTHTAAITEVRAIDAQLSELTGMLAATEHGLAELDTTLADLADRRSKQGVYKDVLDKLGAVRDWFHYGNGPHTLANSVLNSMTSDVNAFLERFRAPFSVVPGNDALGFQYIMNDHSAMPADGYPDAQHLSGGQKIQLAIAFRFAAYVMFASKVGLLSIDEPTNHLDDENVGNFCNVIENIRDIAQKMNLQVLVSTHATAVLPFMDSVINLNTINK